MLTETFDASTIWSIFAFEIKSYKNWRQSNLEFAAHQYVKIMGLEIITDELIKRLLQNKKQAENPRARKKQTDGFERVTYLLSDHEGNRFNLYLRQNIMPGMSDDFSCGLSFLLPSGEKFTLIRYNGPSHFHLNKIEQERFGRVCHIHRATRQYLDKTGKGDGHVEPTSRYKTLEGAFYCLLNDCNIEGLTANPDQPEMF